eukprot:TRINITY_DN10654_c0_g1_i2.p2 TRINITY_DN10654_c0_g1~~TRINITY_DN10654_c0_g1_i2.p2  ORF type:complete len:119 (-),score=31.05 TRINITY_DN10654_c0_g1_i2:50-406(-)
MQRGLVGSEMCIRDRYQRRVHGAAKSEVIHIMQLQEEAARKRKERADFPQGEHSEKSASSVSTNIVQVTENRDRPCLLYTSDAADDTPCVDLGGRRIIKKKNKKPRYLSTHNTTLTDY